jgi:flavin reductase (DIM6/NTAB) family NADH-FMN oxidoreductase RutF
VSADEYQHFQMNDVAEPIRYKLFMGAIVPRPIALVTTLGPHDVVNAAPFSSFMSLSAVNNLVAISINERDSGGVKDTVRNIVARREFVINTVAEPLAVQAQTCADHFPPDVSEVTVAGLGLIPSRAIATPRIVESPIHFECVLHSILPFETAQLIVGRVVVMHARNGLVEGARVNLERYAPLGRLAGRAYCKVGDVIDV